MGPEHACDNRLVRESGTDQQAEPAAAMQATLTALYDRPGVQH